VEMLLKLFSNTKIYNYQVKADFENHLEDFRILVLKPIKTLRVWIIISL
jgi:hypothetical protein